MKDIDSLIEFIKFTNKFAEIKRIIYTKDNPRQENDTEHSYQLALASWYIINRKNLNYDLNKVIRYALAHDLVEVYAGDTYFFSSDEQTVNSKKEREEEAAKRIKKEFPEFKNLHETIHEYELKETPESRFVYALDKVLPIINIYLDNGDGWRERKVTLEMLVDNKGPKIIDMEVKKYFDELMEILKKEENRIFLNK